MKKKIILKKPAAKRKPINPKPKRSAPRPFLDPVKASEAAQERKAPRKFQHYTGNGNTDLRKTSTPKPKDWAFRTQSEGRAKLVMPKRTIIKTKKELWPQAKLVSFLRANKINVGNEFNRWVIIFDEPGRKCTAQDEVDLLMAPDDRMYFVKHNLPRKYVNIERKEGEPNEE